MTTSVAAGERGIFVNRTLNLRSIRAIGYDMDYTLIHYHHAEWEGAAFRHAQERLAEAGFPVEDLVFDATKVIRGLAIDLEEGNLLKATRFGYVIRAAHGTRMLEFDELRSAYQGIHLDLGEERFEFINVLFSLSEASLFAQLVDLLDAGEIPVAVGYRGLYLAIRDALDGAHQDGALKKTILSDPERYVVADPEMVLALLDQANAGKRLMLITNSDWDYADRIMHHAFDAHLPSGTTWRGLFETVIVAADKPTFFTSTASLYKVVDEERSLLAPHHGPISPGSVFFGGCAAQVEESMELSGDQILYVGDHLFGDVRFSKALLRWRTALILRELETEVRSAGAFRSSMARMQELMARKEAVEADLAALRLANLRAREGYAAPGPAAGGDEKALRASLESLDEELAPLAQAASELRNATWGPLMRAGIDKSMFARQVERYADVYTSRVANFLGPGPYAILRAHRASLPHDSAL